MVVYFKTKSKSDLMHITPVMPFHLVIYVLQSVIQTFYLSLCIYTYIYYKLQVHIHMKYLHDAGSHSKHSLYKKLCYKHSAGMSMLLDQASLKEACDLRASFHQ